MFSDILFLPINIIKFLIFLSPLILVHELGHFLMAKKFGIKVEEFGFGLPPRLIGKKIGETIYSINWLPIGGFVKLYGEEGEEESSKSIPQLTDQKSKLSERAFYTRPAWQRAAVLVAGVSMNFLFALAVITFLFTRGVYVPSKRVHVDQVTPNSPASQAKIQPNDIIVAINDRPIATNDELVAEIKKHLGEPTNLTVLRGANFDHSMSQDECRNCQLVTVSVTLRKNAPPGQGPMGVLISSYEKRSYAWYQAPIQGLKESFMISKEIIFSLGQLLWKVVTLQSVSKDVAGPIGIYKVSQDAAKQGLIAQIYFLGLLSLNLAIFNILPIPALDGGRLLFVIIEGLFHKRFHIRWEQQIHQIGMALLLALLLLVTINDVLRLLGKV